MSSELFTMRLRGVDTILLIINGSLSFYLAISLFSDLKAITIQQSVPLTVMAVSFIASAHMLFRMLSGSTNLILNDNSIILTEFWMKKCIPYEQVSSFKLLEKGEARGLLSRKTIRLILRSGRRVIIPDCFNVTKEGLSLEIESRLHTHSATPAWCMDQG